MSEVPLYPEMAGALTFTEQSTLDAGPCLHCQHLRLVNICDLRFGGGGRVLMCVGVGFGFWGLGLRVALFLGLLLPNDRRTNSGLKT